MFGLLAPAALAGLALLSIPVLLHIFKPKKVRQTPFSSLRWLRASQHRMSRRIKWHQVLLFALRAGFIALIVLALAKPIVSFNREGNKADRFVIVDLSRSMDYRLNDDDMTPAEKARKLAGPLAGRVIAGDRTTVVLAGQDPQVLGPLVGDAGPYLARAASAKVEQADVSMTDALELIRPMVAGGDADRDVELFFVTDNHTQSWTQQQIARFDEAIERPIRVNIVDVGMEVAANAWIAEARIVRTGEAPRIRVQLGAAGPTPLTRTVRRLAIDGLPEDVKPVDITPGRATVIEFDLPKNFDLRGKVAEIQIEPSDGLASDDRYWVNLDRSGAMKVLVIEPETTQVVELQPGFHLRTALGALAATDEGSLILNRRLPTDVLAADLADADVIFMIDTPTLPESNLASLEQRVREGAGLVVFLGGSIDTEFYNTKMHQPLRPTDSLLPVTLGDRIQLAGDASPTIAQVNQRHPMFARLLDPIYGDLSQVRFTSYYQINQTNAGDDVQSPAWIGQQQPAMIEHQFGAGRVVLMNTTANDAWSDLPRRKSFVPLLDRMLGYLASGPRRGSFGIGQPITLPLPAVAEGQVQVLDPDGAVTPSAVRELSGKRYVQIEGLDVPGAYRVSYVTSLGEGGYPFVVQPGGDDSLMNRADADTLKAWWGDAKVTFIRPDPQTAEIDLQDTRLMLEPWMIGLALACLLAEMFFVHWLCPKVNPSVVSHSVVAHHGFFAGGEAGESEGRAKDDSSTATGGGTPAVQMTPKKPVPHVAMKKKEKTSST